MARAMTRTGPRRLNLGSGGWGGKVSVGILTAGGADRVCLVGVTRGRYGIGRNWAVKCRRYGASHSSASPRIPPRSLCSSRIASMT